VCGLIVHVYGVALIACGGMVQAMIAAVDYSAPVLDIQKRLARLRKFYVRTGLVVGLAWWLIWMPVMAAVFMTVFGADLYLNAPSVFVIGGAAGVAGLLATWWFHRWSRHPKRPRLAKAMDDSLIGISLRRAQALADEIARFERD
jgi:serine/threonine-protein kinase